MLRTSESETEILLGNKQLIGIFFVVAALLGVAFYGGYMVGRAGNKTADVTAPAPVADTTSTAKTSTAGGETHSFPTDTNPSSDQSAATQASPQAASSPAAPSHRAKRRLAHPSVNPPRRGLLLRRRVIMLRRLLLSPVRNFCRLQRSARTKPKRWPMCCRRRVFSRTPFQNPAILRFIAC